jgi:hypothetical protein
MIITLLTVTVLFLFTFFNLILDAPRIISSDFRAKTAEDKTFISTRYIQKFLQRGQMEEDALEDEERTEDKANSSLASSVAEPEVQTDAL